MAIVLGKGVFNKGVCLFRMAAQASRLESEDTIDIVSLKEVSVVYCASFHQVSKQKARTGVHEIHFLLFSVTDWEGIMLQFSKGAPKQILDLNLGAGQVKDDSIVALPVDELIEKSDGFAGVFPECKYNIMKCFQARKHTCGMTVNGINDYPALKKADIRIAVADATNAARSASGEELTEADLTKNKQWMKFFMLGFILLVLVRKFDFPPVIILIIAIPNDAYSAMMTCIFFWAAYDTYFYRTFEVRSLQSTENHPTNFRMLVAAIYLQVSLIFATRPRSWSFVERQGLLLIEDFIFAQLEVPEGRKESPRGCPLSFLGLLTPFDLVRHDIVEARRRAVSLCAPVKMISGDQLGIVKETGRRLERKYKIVKYLEAWKHFCWMTGDGLNNVAAVKEADIGIVVADVLAKPEPCVFMSAVPSSRDIQSLIHNPYCDSWKDFQNRILLVDNGRHFL